MEIVQMQQFRVFQCWKWTFSFSLCACVCVKIFDMHKVTITSRQVRTLSNSKGEKKNRHRIQLTHLQNGRVS